MVYPQLLLSYETPLEMRGAGNLLPRKGPDCRGGGWVPEWVLGIAPRSDPLMFCPLCLCKETIVLYLEGVLYSLTWTALPTL